MPDSTIAPILKRAEALERLSPGECLALMRSRDLISIGRAAHRARLARADSRLATYNRDRNINYTNICSTACAFCAFCRPPGSPEAYILGEEQFRARIAELYATGGSQILLQGGHHPGLPLEWHEALLRWLRAEWPGLHLHCYSPTEIAFWARQSGLSPACVVGRLRDAGLQSLPGGGAEILSDRPRRKLSPEKCSADEWIAIMRETARAGLRGTATMMFGHIETDAERVEHLLRLRDLQDETGVFTAFAAWTFQPKNTPLKDKYCGAHEYLRVAAIARLFLDNIPNHQASWVTQGPRIGQISLLFGLNDLGSTMIEENVVREAGTAYRMDAAGLEALARQAGFEPMQRDYYYRPYRHPGDRPEGLRQTEHPFPEAPRSLAP